MKEELSEWIDFLAWREVCWRIFKQEIIWNEFKGGNYLGINIESIDTKTLKVINDQVKKERYLLEERYGKNIDNRT